MYRRGFGTIARHLTAIIGLAGALLALTLMTAAPAAAQVNTATIEAVVLDNSNQALPGVTVRVTSPETGFDTTAVTDPQGLARLSALRPGIYDMAFELQGFSPLVQKGLALRVGQTLVVNATLQAQLTETVTVAAEAPVVDVHKTDTSTNIVPEQIQALPVADRDFQRLAFIAPGVQRERGGFRFVTGGPVIGSGGNASQSTILVDGMDFTDPALGLAFTKFSQDSIREFRVIQDRFDTEVGGSSGGALSIVTSSGTNTEHGKVFAFFRNDALRAKGALEAAGIDNKKVPYSRQQFGGVVGGPLVRDKAHYFLSFEQVSENNITLVRPKGAFATQAKDASLAFDQSLLFGRIDHQINGHNRLAGRFVYERYRGDNFRVGGISDEANGLHLNRNNVNGNFEYVWAGNANKLNQLYIQVGHRKYVEPPNTVGVLGEWFSSGNTLQTGTSLYADLLGEGTFFEARDQFLWHFDANGSHDVKTGFAWQHVKDRFDFPVYKTGILFYATDTRAIPIVYVGATGSGDARISTNRLAGYIQDDWAPRSNVRVNFGLRYDVDTKGNNPDFTHPLRPNGRLVDKNNIQPRGSMTWDITGNGRSVIRAGAGLYVGRYLLVPPFGEIQQNGISGRLIQQRVSGLLFGLPASTWLDAANPATTGIALKPDITLLDTTYDSPETTQFSGGWTTRIANTRMYVDVTGIYVKGRKEIIIRDKNFGGNTNPVRPNTTWNQINTYTNDGHSEYKAMVLSLNGTITGGHMITASYTLGSKKNINDDFSPELPFGYPNDPANIEGDYGRSRTDERHHLVLTGIFNLPFRLTLAPIVEYGSGQPYSRRLGYDFNGDGKNSDRTAGVGRNTETGDNYKNVNLRLTWAAPLAKAQHVEFIVEAFNLFNTRNDSPATIDGSQYLSGPTLANPAAAFVNNTNYGKASATLPSREVQLGIRWTF